MPEDKNFISQEELVKALRAKGDLYRRKQEEEVYKELAERLGLTKPQPIVCHYCGNEVPEDKKYYFIYFKDKEVICHTCFYTLPKCKNCGGPVKSPNSAYCDYCKPGYTCSSCGKTVSSPKELSHIPGVKGVYCKDCLALPRCKGCGRPIPHEGYCDTCKVRLVDTQDKADQIITDMVRKLNSILDVRVIPMFKLSVIHKPDQPDRIIRSENKLLIVNATLEEYFLAEVAFVYGIFLGLKLEVPSNMVAFLDDIGFWTSYYTLRLYKYIEMAEKVHEKVKDNFFYKKLLYAEVLDSPKNVVSKIKKILRDL